MKYISIDIETTGIDPELDQILSIGLVIEDTLDIKPIDELPSLHLVITNDRLQGNVFALDMNRDIIKLLKTYQVSNDEARSLIEDSQNVKFVKEYEVAEKVFNFLYVNDMVNPSYYRNALSGHVRVVGGAMIPILGMTPDITTLTVAGKNFGTFDKLFIEKLTSWKRVFKFHQRILDPAILFVDWKRDLLLPNLNTCMERAGVEGEVTHDAIDDAKDVIKVLRTNY